MLRANKNQTTILWFGFSGNVSQLLGKQYPDKMCILYGKSPILLKRQSIGNKNFVAGKY